MRRTLLAQRVTLPAIMLALALTVSCRQEHSISPESTTESNGGPAIFLERSSETGLDFHHFIGATGKFYMPEIMGAGVAVFDFENDGDLDVFFPQGAKLHSGTSTQDSIFPLPAGHSLGNRLFRNELVPSGTLRFVDVTEESGLAHSAYGMGAATGDIDNDGFTDLYVTNFGSNLLYRNLGNGKFQDITRTAGVDDPRWSTSATFVDYNRDGRLDLFVLNYLDFTVRGHKDCQAPTGEPDYCTPKAYDPVTATLFRNEGGNRFTNVTRDAGLDRARGPGLGVTATDLNADGWIDLYVANDGMANLLWVNKQDGTFAESGLESGAAYAEDGIARAGMGVAAGDIDGDGDDDIFVANLAMEGATLFRNDGPIGFLDITRHVGLAEITYPFTGFGTDWFDLDNDGNLDLFIANGAVTREEGQRGQPYPFRQQNLLIRNEGDGASFRNATGEGGQALALREVSRGAAFGDIDNDGDTDIVVSNNNGPARLLLNQAVEQGAPPAITLRLRGVTDNSAGLGARVSLRNSAGNVYARTVHTDSSYCSASASDIQVAAGFFAGQPAESTVVWPSGQKEMWRIQPSAALVALVQGSGIAAP